MWWTSSCGGIELQITKAQAAACSHPGPCDADVLALSKVPAIQRQLAKLDPETVRTTLDGYGAWDGADLDDHEQNLRRLLWCACCDITEEVATKQHRVTP